MEEKKFRPIRPECERRITRLETILENHIPHVEEDLKSILLKVEKIDDKVELNRSAILKIMGGIGVAIFIVQIALHFILR
jgi:hypothetical protein